MNSFWDFFGLLIWSFVFVAYLMILFQIITDLFRDKDLSGWWKAIWIVGLVVLPFLVALIYLIARGQGMGERHLEAVRSAQATTDQYIKSVAGSASGPTAAEQISSAKTLLDNGTINQAEFDQLKAKALA